MFLPHELSSIAVRPELMKPKSSMIPLPHEIPALRRQAKDSLFIRNQIQLHVFPKDPSSSFSWYNPEAYVDLSLKDFNSWGVESNKETYPTMAVFDMQVEACYDDMMSQALTKLGLQERFFEQVTEELRVRVAEEVVPRNFIVYAKVDIHRVSLDDDVVQSEDNSVPDWS